MVRRIDLDFSAGIKAGHRVNGVSDLPERAAGVHPDGTPDRRWYAHQRLQPRQARSGERHEGPGEIGARADPDEFDVAVHVGLDRLEGLLIESHDDSGNAIVIHQKIRAFTHDPQGCVDLSAATNQLGERFDGVRANQEVRRSAGTEPT